MERCARLIADVTGAQVSPGWVSSVLGEAETLVADSVMLIRSTLTHVLHGDETTTRIRTTRRWLHVACTTTLTLLGLGDRSRDGANALGVPPEFRGCWSTIRCRSTTATPVPATNCADHIWSES